MATSATGGGELAWLRREAWRSLAHPLAFARDLRDERYGIAGLLVALAAGAGISLGTDLLVAATGGIDPGPLAGQMAVDAGLLGVRLAATVAVVAGVASATLRVLRWGRDTVDPMFNSLAFATAPLIFVVVPGALAALAPAEPVLVLAALLTAALIGRALAGVALNVGLAFPRRAVALSLATVVVLGALGLADQVSRLRFLAYELVPSLAPALGASPATGHTYERSGFDITLPAGWEDATKGIPGEAARFESSSATLTVVRARAGALDTLDSYADGVARSEQRGLERIWAQRSVVRVNGVVMVDDRYGGTYEGMEVVYRQLTEATRGHGLALLYHEVGATDRLAVLAQAASIAVTWRITAP